MGRKENRGKRNVREEQERWGRVRGKEDANKDREWGRGKGKEKGGH